jgi:putative Mn2+ efflux pump MntP
MGFVELLLIGVGLSMDAFAVSICKGLGMQRVNWGHSLVIALFFGGFQALMPLLGWALGSQFAAYVTPVAPWVAFALLAFVGGKMLWDAFHEDEGDEAGQDADKLDVKELLMLAVATSIDAFAVGLSFAFLQVDIVSSVAIIGVTTFALSLVGVSAGNVFGSRWERPSTIAGGVILILIGLHTLLDGLGILPF